MASTIAITTRKRAVISKSSLIKYLIGVSTPGTVLLAFALFVIINSFYVMFADFNAVKDYRLALLLVNLVAFTVIFILARVTIDLHWLLKKPNLMVGATVTRLVLMPFLKSHKVDFATLRNTNLVFYTKDDKLIVAEIHAECPICKTVGKSHELKPAISFKRSLVLLENGHAYPKTIYNTFVLECEAGPLHAFEASVEDLESGELKNESIGVQTLHTEKESV